MILKTYVDRSFYKKKYIYIFFAILISCILIFPKDITWARDRFNYLWYASSSWHILKNNFNSNIFVLTVNEPLFLIINSLLSNILAPENVIKTIIFFASFFTLYSLGKMSKFNYWILFFFLFIPPILLKYTVHLRQGLAMSVYFIGISGYKERKSWKYLRFLAPFIHTSVAFILLFEFFESFFKKIKFSSDLRLLVSSIILTAFMFLIPNIALLLGDRRTQVYDFEVGLSGSGLGLLIWIMAGSFFVLFRKEDYIKIICDYGIIFYCVSYFYLDFGARIFECILPLILLSSLTDNKIWFKRSFILFFILYSLILWYTGALNGFI